MPPPGPQREAYVLTRWLFLRLLGVGYFCAFAFLAPQVRGLIGSHGILPARDFLAAVQGQTGAERYWLVPTLAWLDPGDRTLDLLCGAGALGGARSAAPGLATVVRRAGQS